MLLLILLLRQFYKFVSFPEMNCWKANMTIVINFFDD